MIGAPAESFAKRITALGLHAIMPRAVARRSGPTVLRQPRAVAFGCLLILGVVGCRRENKEPAESTPAPSSSVALPTATRDAVAVVAPAASVPLGESPDVRLSLLDQREGSVKVGQTLGVWVPNPADWLDAWEPDGKSTLGEPLTFVSRGADVMELLFKIDAANVGTHKVRLRLMHRATRDSSPVPTKRVEVVVRVLP